VLAIRDCPRPVVARVQGLCLAGGLGLALACDLVVASEEAAFGLPEVDIGLWPFMVGALVARHVSPKRALDLMLTGRRVPAAEAYDMGLVSRVVPAAALDETVAEVCAGLAAKSPLVLRRGKAAWYSTEEVALAPALATLQGELSLLTQSKDAVEGVTAFFQKRPPEWTGR
jgi:enoyl-CoA hydratase